MPAGLPAVSLIRMFPDPALTARRVAVCFDCQLVERVPAESHDAEVDAIVTEAGWIEVRNQGYELLRPGSLARLTEEEGQGEVPM